MFTEHVSSVYYKHHIKHRTFFLTMQYRQDFKPFFKNSTPRGGLCLYGVLNKKPTSQ